METGRILIDGYRFIILKYKCIFVVLRPGFGRAKKSFFYIKGEVKGMKRVGKRALSFTLAVLLIVSMLPTIAFAKTGDTPIVALRQQTGSLSRGTGNV